MDEPALLRSIGEIIAEVTVKEQGRDELAITSHPVERGAAITDHAFRQPALLTVMVGWSAANPDGTPLDDLYNQLRALQSTATLLEVQTGKRLYRDMLIRSLVTETDQTTENVLLVTVQLQEVILVDTIESTMPPANVRSNPQAANGVTDTGTKSTTPAADPTG